MSGCEPGAAPLNVAVLLSGGVDSSLALRLLTAAGHRCRAFYLQIWFQEDFRNFWDQCPWEEDLSFARQVCDSLGVPLEVVPMTKAYWDRVVSSSVEEIRAGRTPNPDILCNSRVKFGAFLEYLETSTAGGGEGDGAAPMRFDRVASGHYARVERSDQDGTARLALTPDAVKDQTYFLAHLSPAQLQRAMFPLGALSKSQVRALAAAAGLATQSRKDSQGICFLGKVKFPEFVREHLGEWRGLIVEDEPAATSTTNATVGSSDGGGHKGGAAPTLAMFGGRRVLGVHPGFWFFTVGQRGGIKLPGGPWYVVRKDCELNVVYVSRHYNEAGRRRDAFVTSGFSWLSSNRPDTSLAAPAPLLCKVRHGPHAYRCQVRSAAVGSGCSNGGTGDGPVDWAEGVVIVLDGCDQGLAPGQYAVLYQGGVCLGTAKIEGCVDVERGYDAPNARGCAGTLTAAGLCYDE